MLLFPQTNLKAFKDCQHGEFVSIQVRSDTYSGICIHVDSEEHRFLVLASSNDRLVYRLINQKGEETVLSYGTDWTLSPFGKLIEKQMIIHNTGAVLQSNRGIHIVAEDATSAFSDLVLCRLDEPDACVAGDFTGTSQGFAWPYWYIHYIDSANNARRKLAGKEGSGEEGD